MVSVISRPQHSLPKLLVDALWLKEPVDLTHTKLLHTTPYFWKNPPQTTTCVTSDAKHSTAYILCLPRQVEWIRTVEQCGVLGILCHTGGSQQEGLSALRLNKVTTEEEMIKWSVLSLSTAFIPNLQECNRIKGKSTEKTVNPQYFFCSFLEMLQELIVSWLLWNHALEEIPFQISGKAVVVSEQLQAQVIKSCWKKTDSS